MNNDILSMEDVEYFKFVVSDTVGFAVHAICIYAVALIAFWTLVG